MTKWIGGASDGAYDPAAAGTAEASKALVLDSSGNVNFPSGTNIKVRGDSLFDSNGNIIASVPMTQGTTSGLVAVVLKLGEYGFDTTTKIVKIGDGTTAFDSLPAAFVAPVANSVRKLVAATLTRTSDTAGTLAVPAGHGIATGSTFFLIWAGMSATGTVCLAGTVTGTSIPFTKVSGEVVPANGAMVVGQGMAIAEIGVPTCPMTAGYIHWDAPQKVGNVIRYVFYCNQISDTGDGIAINYPAGFAFSGVPNFTTTAFSAKLSYSSDTSICIDGVSAVTGYVIAEGLAA